MIVVAILLLIFAAAYLGVAERELRVANADAPPWLERVGLSAQRHFWILLAVVLAHVVHVLRGMDARDDLSFVVVGIVVYLLVSLSTATFSLRRGGQDA